MQLLFRNIGTHVAQKGLGDFLRADHRTAFSCRSQLTIALILDGDEKRKYFSMG